MQIKAKQYARALYEIGQKQGILQDFLAGLAVAKESLSKQQFIIPQNIDKYFANFLTILYKNNDLTKLKNIYYVFKEIYNKDNNLADVEVTLAYKPQQEEKQNIEQALKSSLGKNITATYIVNPKILGGMTIKMGDKLVDNSLQNKLRVFQKELAA